MTRCGSGGFTLIELVMVIVLTGILAAVASNLLTGPVLGYVASGQRAALVDVAESALQRMTREMRLALPNSVRVSTSGGITSVEFLRVLEGGRYRAEPTTGPMPHCGPPVAGTSDPLEFACADPAFDVLGNLLRLGSIQTGANCMAGVGNCLVVFNTGQGGANAYAGDNLASISGTSAGTGDDGSDQLTLSSARLTAGNPAFPLRSPAQRFYVVDTPVSFVCNPGAGTLTRYSGYTITAGQSTSPGGSGALLARGVSGCQFSYAPGTATRGGLASLSVTLSEPNLGEAVTLMQEVHVENVP